MLEYWSNRWCGVRVWPHAPGCCGAEAQHAICPVWVAYTYVIHSDVSCCWTTRTDRQITVQVTPRDDELHGPSLARCVVIVVSR